MALRRLLFTASFLSILTGTLLAQDSLRITGRILDTNGAAITGANDVQHRTETARAFDYQTVLRAFTRAKNDGQNNCRLVQSSDD